MAPMGEKQTSQSLAHKCVCVFRGSWGVMHDAHAPTALLTQLAFVAFENNPDVLKEPVWLESVTVTRCLPRRATAKLAASTRPRRKEHFGDVTVLFSQTAHFDDNTMLEWLRRTAMVDLFLKSTTPSVLKGKIHPPILVPCLHNSQWFPTFTTMSFNRSQTRPENHTSYESGCVGPRDCQGPPYWGFIWVILQQIFDGVGNKKRSENIQPSHRKAPVGLESGSLLIWGDSTDHKVAMPSALSNSISEFTHLDTYFKQSLI